MSDRLKFFRRLMSAFEGTSNPQRAVERGFYVNLPNNPIEEITGRVALRPSSVHLLFGGIGSGKTTQLLLTQQALNELEDIKAIYVDVSLVTDISNLQSGALIAIAGIELIKILDEYNVRASNIDDIKRMFEKVLDGNNETVTRYILASPQSRFPAIGGIPIASGIQVPANQGFTTTEKRESRISILQAFDKISRIIKEKTPEKIIFLFDSLDRLKDSKIFVDSALDDITEIRKYKIGSILVGSIVIPYIERVSIAEIVGRFDFLPYLDVLENDEVLNFFTEIFKVRDPQSFIASDARELLIYKSGGVLRDLMSLCQTAIEEAYMDGSDLVTEQHANQAILAIERSKIIGLTDSSIEILSKVMTENLFSPRTSEDFDLLLTSHILEYRYPRRRFVVHPILVPILEKMVAGVANG
jgi:Cdc6-like AAA superfamily ATPase